MKRICLVGNGRGALGRGLGSWVDEFDWVVRFNQFLIADHVADVGRKITHHVRHYGVMFGCAGAQQIRLAAPKDYAALVARPDVKAGEVLPLRILLETANAAKLRNHCHPSSGLAAVGLFLHLMQPGDELVAFNFDHGATGHYFRNRHSHSSCHDWEREAEFFAQLEKDHFIARK